MRFVILTQYYPPEIGAPQLRLPAMVRELRAIGHEVEVVTAMPNYPSGRIMENYRGRFYLKDEVKGVVVHRVWMYAATGAGLRRLVSYLSFALTALWGILRARRADYLFVESPPLFLSATGFLVSRLQGSRMIFNVSDLWPDSARELGIIKHGWMLRFAEWLEAWSYRKSYKITAVTEGIRSTLTGKKGVPATKVLYLPNGADTEVFSPRTPDHALAASLGLNGVKVVLYAGTHGYAQGLEVVLEAARRLEHRPDIKFVLIGDGPEKTMLVEKARSYGLSNVTFLNPSAPKYVADLCSLSIAGLVSLRKLPLFEGARPSKILTTLASGAPVLYSGAGEGARLVEEARAGLVVQPENPEALAEAVIRLADNQEMARAMGRNGRMFVKEHFSWSVLVGGWITELKQET